jgi:hypothetical protein
MERIWSKHWPWKDEDAGQARPGSPAVSIACSQVSMKAQREGAPGREALEPEGRHMARFVEFPLEAEPGERIETAVFEICRYRWALWVCPGGMTEEHVEFVSVFLAYKGETSLQARFQFTLIDRHRPSYTTFQLSWTQR